MHRHTFQTRSSGELGRHVPLLDATRERLLLVAALAGDERAASELVRSHARLVMKVAARYRRGALSWDDLVSEGMLGLVEAMRRFDVSQETRFAAYATWWIRARVSQFAQANRRLVRAPSTRNARAVVRGLRRTEHKLAQRLARAPTADELATELGVSAADVAEIQLVLGSSDLAITPAADRPGLQLAADVETPEQALEQLQTRVERQAHVDDALSRLSARERQVVRDHYLAEDGRTLSELGADSGVSRQRVGQVLSNARDKLKRALAQVA